MLLWMAMILFIIIIMISVLPWVVVRVVWWCRLCDDADLLSMADIEKKIREYADKVQNNKLTIEEMTGGTFTITNGGVFGSMLSTPIINPPQSAILGMHKIVDRPVVEKGAIVIRPDDVFSIVL